MIGDPLYDAIARRRDKKRSQRPPEPPRPEGVALYKCAGEVFENESGRVARADLVDNNWYTLSIGCGATAEAKPYAKKPRCHDRDMAIAGYDWERDVEA